jgi:hypothetical protein
MSICPSCNQRSSDPGAPFCAYCGFALPDGEGAADGLQESALEPPPAPTGGGSSRRWHRPAWSADAGRRAVAVGLVALVSAAVLAILLSYGSGGRGHVARALAASSGKREAAATRTSTSAGRSLAPAHHVAMTDPQAEARPHVGMTRYQAGGYAFTYPSAWRIAQGDRPVADYRETVLQSADGSAKVNVDYSPGERTEPTFKAAQVEEPTSATPGYRRISFGPTTVNGHAAFAWDFVVADADPRRADLFIRTATGDFALLAHGADFPHAKSAARLIAASLDAAR